MSNIVKYFNAMVKIAMIRVAREYITILANSLTFVTAIKGKPVKLRQLHCSGTIKKCEIKARVLLNTWLNKTLKTIVMSKSEEEQLKEIMQKEIQILAEIE